MPKEEDKKVEVSPSEQKAREGGWTPKEDWSRDPDEWVDHKEFNFRGELMGRIQEQSSILDNFKRQIAERDTALKDMSKLQENLAEREYKKALTKLRQEKALAVEEGDGIKVVELDDEIDELKDRKPVPQPEIQAAQGTPPEVIDWLKSPENQWYHKDEFLKSVADGIAKGILEKDNSIAPSVLLDRMNKKIREELPHKFGAPKGNPVDDGGGDSAQRGGSGKPKKHKFSDLDEDQQAVAKRFAKLGVMTVDEYIEELVSVGEL